MENQRFNAQINPGALCADMTSFANMFNHINDKFDKATEDMRKVFRNPNISVNDKQKVYDCYSFMYLSWRDACRLGPPPMDFPPLQEFMEAIIARVGGRRAAKKNTRMARKTRKNRK
jgi:hypothetical protein